jgi:TATA-binding protein-associated factor
METDQILDLFNLSEGGEAMPAPSNTNDNNAREEDMVDATGEVKEKGKKGLFDDIGELWDPEQYAEEYNLDNFLQSMKG